MRNTILAARLALAAAGTVVLLTGGVASAVGDDAAARRAPGTPAVKAPHARPAPAPALLRGGAACGDSILDGGEQCDDGNAADGDGCSSSCQIEDGWSCSLPVPPQPISALADQSFEAGTPNPSWAEGSTNFGTPLCDSASCGTGGGTGANTGDWWAWFGGIATFEAGFVEQTVVLPSSQPILSFAVEQAACDTAADYMRLTIDGNEVFITDGADPSCDIVGYRTETIDLFAAPGGPYNDDASHVVRFESEVFGTTGTSNFFVDDVVVQTGTLPPEPSQCEFVGFTCSDVEGFEGGIPAGWTVFNQGANPIDWGTTGDGVCWSGGLGPPPADNVTGGAGEAACIDSDASGSPTVDSFLCSSAYDLTEVTAPRLNFLYNYQLFSIPGPDDIFEVSAGTVAPNLGTVGGYTPLFDSNGVNAGAFADLPGVEESADLSAFAGGSEVYFCFRYGGDFDWYAQVDEVAVSGDSCGAADSDNDGVPDDQDNCVLFDNPLQVDNDGDGIGNACDPDYNQDCAVNFLDLGSLKGGFFSTDPNLDLTGVTGGDPDGAVNFSDLGRLKALVFRDYNDPADNPSGISNICIP